jgi:hypothetical protein
MADIAYETRLNHLEDVRRKLRSCLFRNVRLVLDPRVVAAEDVQEVTGMLAAVSSVTDMVALEQSEDEYVETTRRRQRMNGGWLVSFRLAELLDVEPIR